MKILNEPWFWRIYIALLIGFAVLFRVTHFELPAVVRVFLFMLIVAAVLFNLVLARRKAR